MEQILKVKDWKFNKELLNKLDEYFIIASITERGKKRILEE